MTGCVIKQEEAPGKAICLALKYVNRTIDLGNDFLRVEVTVAILPWFEYNTGITAK